MNNIGITLTADNKAMIKALQDAEKAMASMGKDMSDALKQVQAQANQTGQAMAGMANPNTLRGMAQLNKQVGEVGMSAKATTAALRQVPAQFTDIIVSLQGGQAPLTVLLQQGGQLKDVFGGIGPAARALGGYVLGLVNPVTLVAAAVLSLGIAFRSGMQEMQAYRNAIASTGNASGVTVNQLAGMAASMDEVSGQTKGQAAEALAAMVATGRVARASMQDYAQTAMTASKVFGQAIEDTAKNFGDLGKDPVGASKRLNESLNYLTAATYEQIVAAKALGQDQKAAALAQEAYAKGEASRAAMATQNLGYLEKAWKAVTGAVIGTWNMMRETWDWFKSLGREEAVSVQIAAARKELDLIDKGLRNVSPRQKAALEQQLAALQETEKLAKLSGDKQAERVAAEKAGIAAVDAAAEAAKKNREAREAAAKKSAEEAMRMIEDGVKLQQSLTAQDSGLSPEFAKQWDNLGKAYKANKISLEQLLEAQKLLLDQQPFVKKAAKDREDAAKEMEAAAKREADGLKITNQLREESLKPYEQSLKAQQKRVDALEDEEKAIAISRKMNISLAQAVEMVNIARLEEQITAARAAENFDAVEMLKREIEERKKLVELIGSKEGRDASAKAAKQAADDWQRAADKIQDSITDSLMRGFESGKGFVKNLVDTIKNMFNTMVLRPIVQAVVGSGLSAIGLGGAGGAQAGGLGNIGQSMLGNFAQSAIGTSIISSSAAYGAAIGTTSIGAGSQAAMLAAQTSGFGSAGTLMTAQAAGTGSSMMASAAAAGPYVAAALLAANALGLFRSKKIVGGGLSGTLGEGDIESYDLQRRGGTLFSGPSYSIVNRQVSEQSEALQTAFKAMRDATAGMATQLGLANDSILTFTTQLGKDLIHPDTGGYGIKLDGLNPEQAAAKVQEALQAANEEMAQQLLGTFQTTAGEAGKWVFTDFGDGVIQEYIDAVEPVTTWIAGPFVRDNETAAQALLRLSSSLTSANDMLDMMNVSLYETSLQGADAASALVDLFGGIEGFTASTAAYYQAFYTEAERSEKVTERLTKALSDQNLELPDSIQSYRALVDAQDRNTEAGRKTYASLIQLAPAFAQVTSAAEQQRKDLQRQLFELTATKDQLEADARSKIDESNLAIYDQIKALEKKKIADEAAAQAQEEYRQAAQQAAEESARAAEQVRNAWKQIGDNVIAEINRIRGVTGSNSTTNQALAQAQFATTTARARAGSQEALAALPQLSQTLEAASKLTAASALDTARMRAWLAGSLSETLSILGLQTPAFAAGGYHSGGMRLVGENGPELEVTGPSRIYNASQTADMLGGGLAGEMRALREEVSMLRAEARATAINTGRQADLMKRVTRNGEAMTVMTDGEPLEVTS